MAEVSYLRVEEGYSSILMGRNLIKTLSKGLRTDEMVHDADASVWGVIDLCTIALDKALGDIDGGLEDLKKGMAEADKKEGGHHGKNRRTKTQDGSEDVVVGNGPSNPRGASYGTV